jgi:RNA 2',3'-cyclic 3'-phosphodiesterase
MRCFIAAWPDDASRQRSADLIRRLATAHPAGRPIGPTNVHLTLAFIGTLDDQRAGELAAACGQLGAIAPEWRLDTLVHFARPGVLAAAGPPHAALAAAAAAARKLLAERAIDYDRKPFVPHVTLLRKVGRFDGPMRIEPPVAWKIDHIALYRSTARAGGPQYERVA